MPHRLAHLGAGWYWLIGVSSWFAAKVSLWVQAVAAADPPTATDVFSTGGIAISSGALAMSTIKLVEYIVTTMKLNAQADRDERERIRVAEQADKDRAAREAQAIRDHDARLADAEREVAEAKAMIAAADQRAKVAEDKAARVETILNEVRQRRHLDVIDQNRYMLGTGSQVTDNTDTLNQLLIGYKELARKLGVDVGIPAPVEPILREIPPPVAHIEPVSPADATS